MKIIKKKYLKKIIIYAVIFILFLFLTNPALIPFTSDHFKETVGDVWGSIFGDVSSIAKTFSINWATIFRLIAMILLLTVVSNLLRLILSQIHPKSGQGKSTLSLMSNAVSYLCAIVGLIWGLSIIGVNVTALFAGIGILALVLSFGAETLIEDIITGIFLVFDKQFNVGDIIEIDGFRGTVEQIGIRSTYIRGPGNNIQILNNSSIKKVLNRSIADSIAVCEVSVSYATDLEKLEKVLDSALPEIQEKYPDVFLEAPKYLGVQSLSDSAVVLKFSASVREKDIYNAPRLMLREIKLAFDRSGVEIPFPQVVVHEAKDRESHAE